MRVLEKNKAKGIGKAQGSYICLKTLKEARDQAMKLSSIKEKMIVIKCNAIA